MRKALRRLLAHGRGAESPLDSAPPPPLHQPNQPILRDAVPSHQQLSAHPETGPPASAERIFQYTPLSGPSRFRILHLKRDLDWTPSDNDTGYYHDVRLCGSLYEASINSVPEYFALSYTWGDPTVCEYIILDGTRFGIGANCAAALRRMLRGKMDVHIWVDAICINQADTPDALDERSSQVAMMDKIYKASSRVNVHLSEGDRDTDVAMQLLKKLATAYLGAKMGSKQSRKEYERLADDVLEPTREYPYGKLHSVFSLPWFRRVWVVQEVAMKNRVMLYCGKEMIAMKNLVVASDFTRLPYSKVDSSTNCFHWKSYLGFHDAMQEYVRRKDEGEPTSNFGLTLSTILVLPASNLQATRPEDKIFAFYGICKHLGFELPPPDYRKSLAQIYTEAAIAILRHDGDLSMLQDVCESPGWELGLPSWVPNFAGSIREWTPSNPPNVSIYPKRHPRVAGSSGCHYELTQENQVLKVKGRRLDVVSEVGRAWKTDASTTLLGDSERQTGHYYAALLLCIGTWLDIVTKQDGNGHNSTSSETLTRVIAEGGSPPWDEQTTNHLARYLAILAETAAAAASETEDIETSTRPIMLAAGGDRLDGFQDAGKFTVSGEMHSAVRKIAYMDWKTVFSTARGLLAVGQHTVTKGDNVVILHGCSTAAVLRDWGGMYRYVGSAYVHGIMDGQSWEAGTSANDEWFELV